VKVTTEKLPGSLVALEIELDRDQVEKGLERAARRLSQKYNIPGFRKGKAPRFIVENYFGRPALLEEATDDMLQKAFKSALEQENVDPIGQANLDHVHFDEEPYHFRVVVPVSPTVELPDYRAIRSPIETQDVTDEMVQRALETRRDKHAVLRELDEPRPAQQGDELSVEMEALVDGEPVEPRPEGQPISPSTLILEPERLVEGLYDGLLGATVDQELEIRSQMAEDHPNEKLQGKEVTFATKVLGIKERLLPDWDELPTLEEFDGTLDELREKTREELIESAKSVAERDSVNGYIRQLVDASTFDIPNVLIERQADGMLKDQEQEYVRYGVKPEQVYEYRGVKREDLIRDLLPEAEGRLKTTLALQSVVRGEALSVTPAEIDAELESTLATYNEEQRDQMRQLLGSSYLSMIAETALDKKLRSHILLLANGTAPSQQDGAARGDTAETAEAAEPQPEAAEQVEG
jgi:trigger factor